MHVRKKILPFFILYGLLFSSISNAQEVFTPALSKKITTFSFDLLTGGIIIVKAQLDNFKDTLNFVLDTGSGGISLDSATCAHLRLSTIMSNKVIRGIAGMRTVPFTYGHSLHLPGLAVDSLDFHINDYDILSSVYGIKIDGIIGFSFLRNYIVGIDYEELKLTVYSKGFFKYPRGGSLLHPLFNTLPMQEASVKDEKQIEERFYFDTGAGMCMLFSEDFINDSALLKKKKKIYATQAEGLGGKKLMKITVIKQVKVANYSFRNVPVYIFSDDYNVTNYPTLGGLLGNDLMRRFNIVLNYAAQEIYIRPNRRYLDSFDYSYSGLGMYLINGNIEIGDIMKGSPAEKAGFEVGDVVIAVDNNTTENLQAYKLALQNPKTIIKILVLRNGELKSLFLKVESIL